MRKSCVRSLSALLALAGTGRAESPAPARMYTNDDLDRVSARRGETGVLSRPGPAAEAPPPARETGASSREEHWRRESDRLRDRLQPLRDQADDLRQQIDERSRTPGVKPVTDAKLLALQRRLAAVEARIRDGELQLEERARRARALPGWLR